MLLDKFIAKSLLENPDDASASLRCTHITDDAAELLVNYSGHTLDLGTLREISPVAAALLGEFKGDLLLDSLSDPSPAVLMGLAKIPSKRSHHSQTSSEFIGGKYLSLIGMKSIDEHQAEALSAFRGKLGLGGLVKISDSCAGILGASSCFHLYLDGLNSVTEQALKHLLRRRSIVALNGLEKLPDIEGDWEELEVGINELYLNGLKFSSSKSLKKISSIPIDEIFLDGLETLPQDDEQLFEHCGAALFLSGLKKLTDVDLKILGTNRPSSSLILDGLEELDERQAKELVGTDRGTLSLGLRKMSDEVASVLLRSQSYGFVMNRLEELR